MVWIRFLFIDWNVLILRILTAVFYFFSQPPWPTVLQRLPSILRPIFLILKPIVQFLTLLWYLCVKIPAPDAFIVQVSFMLCLFILPCSTELHNNCSIHLFFFLNTCLNSHGRCVTCVLQSNFVNFIGVFAVEVNFFLSNSTDKCKTRDHLCLQFFLAELFPGQLKGVETLHENG